ncbi:MAG: L,D-transpeptidase family protein [Actinobacteria bacterium]|nr:L,D-transpeptidase family protein [Actinomycetota bacterium]
MRFKRGLIIAGLAFIVSVIIWLAIPSPTSNVAVHVAKVALDEAGSRVAGEIGGKTMPPVEKPPESIALKEACRKHGVSFPPQNIHIVVDKSEFRLYLYSGSKLIKIYPVSLGSNPVDDKVRQGDRCTPEGEFYICQKAENPEKAFLGSRWMRLSYPNKEDAARGLAGGLIDRSTARDINKAIDERKTPPQNTPLGGGIGIHGGSFDCFGKMVVTWTAGCIALYDHDIEEFYDYVEVGARVVVRK